MQNFLKVTFEQDGFTYSSQTVSIKEISFTEGFKFVVNAFAKQMQIAKIMLPTKQRAKLSEPFTVKIETSDGETYENTLKMALPRTSEGLNKLSNKMLKVLGIATLNESDGDFSSNYQLLLEGSNPNFPLVAIDQD
jgi:hypothetical protein